MTSQEYIRKAMSHAKCLGEILARRMGTKDKHEFVRKFIKSMRHAVDRKAREWSGLPDRSKRMRASLKYIKDIRANATKKC